jgi:hypothetical protein
VKRMRKEQGCRMVLNLADIYEGSQIYGALFEKFEFLLNFESVVICHLTRFVALNMHFDVLIIK